MTSATPISTQDVKQCLWYRVGLVCVTDQGSDQCPGAQLQLTIPSRMDRNTDQGSMAGPGRGQGSPKARGPWWARSDAAELLINTPTSPFL